MKTLLQESGGLRRTAAVQSPMPSGGKRLSLLQRVVLGGFVLLLVLSYAVQFLPLPRPNPPANAPAAPAS